MINYKLDKVNKYKGKFSLINEKIKAIFSSNEYRIRFFSAVLALELSIGVLPFIHKGYLRRKDMDYMYYNLYNVEDINSNIVEFKDKYKKLADKYNNMSDEEKNNYVVSVFNDCIDSSDVFTKKEKEILKEKESVFLSKYGKNYYFYNIFNMFSRLKRIKIFRNAELGEHIRGNYSNWTNVINVDKDYISDTPVVGHEVEHAITVTKILKDYSYLYFMESMDSCTDIEYYNDLSYSDKMRNHMFFLSEIIGRDNLLKVYLNSDFNLLKKLLNDDYYELMNLFGMQMKGFRENHGDSDVCDKIAEKLKDIYEKKNNCSIKDDKKMSILYDSSKAISDYHVYSSLFSDSIIYCNTVGAMCLDKIIEIDLKYVYLNNKEYLMTYSLNNIKINYKKKQNNNSIPSFAIRKVDYLFDNKIAKKIINHSNPKVYLKLYLEEIGVSNSDYWTYIILNDKYPIVCCSKLYNYDVKEYHNDLSIILKAKYKQLNSDNKLYELYDKFDIFYLNKNNVNEDDFRIFCKEVLKNDEDYLVDDIINNSKRNSFHHRKK